MVSDTKQPGSFEFVNGPKAVRMLWDSILGSYNPPLYKRIEDYDVYCEKLARRAITACMRDGHGPVGAVSLYANDLEGRVAFVTQLAVRSDCRRLGLGTELIGLAERVARDRGMQEMRLEVAKENATARSLYSHLGYTPVVQSSGTEGLILRKSL